MKCRSRSADTSFAASQNPSPVIAIRIVANFETKETSAKTHSAHAATTHAATRSTPDPRRFTFSRTRRFASRRIVTRDKTSEPSARDPNEGPNACDAARVVAPATYATRRRRKIPPRDDVRDDEDARLEREHDGPERGETREDDVRGNPLVGSPVATVDRIRVRVTRFASRRFASRARVARRRGRRRDVARARPRGRRARRARRWGRGRRRGPT